MDGWSFGGDRGDRRPVTRSLVVATSHQRDLVALDTRFPGRAFPGFLCGLPFFPATV